MARCYLTTKFCNNSGGERPTVNWHGTGSGPVNIGGSRGHQFFDASTTGSDGSVTTFQLFSM
jgi:hypothetical protein